MNEPTDLIIAIKWTIILIISISLIFAFVFAIKTIIGNNKDISKCNAYYQKYIKKYCSLKNVYTEPNFNLSELNLSLTVKS